MDALRWAPRGFAAWIFERSKRPGMVKLRENRTYAHEVAIKLVEEKRRELSDGTPRRDILTLLGSSYVLLIKLSIRYNFQSLSERKLFSEKRLATQ